MTISGTFEPLDPKLQISFFYRLDTIRGIYLLEALRKTVAEMEIPALDQELSGLVPPAGLQRVASFGLRGELFFPVPILLCRNPFLLGYYRLLFGFSQKEFYSKGPFGRFKCMEQTGELPVRIEPLLGELCRSLIVTGLTIAEKMDALSSERIHELQLLTVGPQWRGEENTRIGQTATTEVFKLIRDAVEPCIVAETRRSLNVRNAAGRIVMIEFGSDPDVKILEKQSSGVRPIVSMEIKGGADASNVHNRLGEAEKSHQKAKRVGFYEFWTILRVVIADEVAKAESPTTNRIFNLDRVIDVASPEHKVFVEELTTRIGLQNT